VAKGQGRPAPRAPTPADRGRVGSKKKRRPRATGAEADRRGGREQKGGRGGGRTKERPEREKKESTSQPVGRADEGRGRAEKKEVLGGARVGSAGRRLLRPQHGPTVETSIVERSQKIEGFPRAGSGPAVRQSRHLGLTGDDGSDFLYVIPSSASLRRRLRRRLTLVFVRHEQPICDHQGEPHVSD
jgi:hypothetical protein